MIRFLKGLMGFLQPHFGGGGGGGGQTQNTDPWSGQQPYLKDLFARAQQNLKGGGPQYYPGQTLQPVDPRTQQSLDYATQLAQGQLQKNATGATSAWDTLLGASNVNNNPNLNAAITAAQAPTIRAFTDAGGPLASIRDQFQGAGQFGGTRQGVAEGIAADRLQQNLLGTGAQMAQAAYLQGLDSTARGLVLTPQVQASQLSPATTLDAVGQESRALQQQFIDDQMQRWDYNQNLPAANLTQYQNLIQGNFGGQTSTTTKVNRTTQAIGMAATGAALGSVIPGVGTAVGAGVGLIAGLFM